ncbi:PLC-like phosphodiesterase [Pseudomassariella vexata]|uniref:PLC-like phosphodiesterase n=1 Tax=Pseudomassariella vexata TaxID=1141098 RepID=A0A1Y2DPS0_9PEZI|nr:PLC-like phosphodiesterase [Pseudomassariella vexata]ORY61278.1 PLC-like phosphodiesterase [Pseudomassariella vexata]
MRSLITILGLLTQFTTAATCNGHDELCDRQYSNITFVGSHNSAFVGYLPVDNQFTSVADQLSQGVRFLQAQTHDKDGTVELCHTSCLEEDAGSLEGYLVMVKTFLDSNADEVVTLLLTNGDGIAGADFAGVFEAAGIDSYAYSPGSNLALAEWPTLGELISAGTRLVVFMDYPADDAVSYILDEFTSVVNSPLISSHNSTTDASFPQCSIDRPSGASASGRMYLVNHYLDTEIFGIDIPNAAAAATTNSASSILAQANLCAGLYRRNPNFIILDWISVGDAIAVQNELNGVS